MTPEHDELLRKRFEAVKAVRALEATLADAMHDAAVATYELKVYVATQNGALDDVRALHDRWSMYRASRADPHAMTMAKTILSLVRDE